MTGLHSSRLCKAAKLLTMKSNPSKVTKLLKEYEMHTETDYYDMIMQSMSDGQYEQAEIQFCKLPESNRVSSLDYLADIIYNNGHLRPLAYSTIKRLIRQIY